MSRVIFRSVFPQNLKLITFDATGTLLQFRKDPADVYLEFGTKYGFSPDRENLRKSFRQQWSKLSKSDENFGSCWQSWWKQFVIGTFKVSFFFLL